MVDKYFKFTAIIFIGVFLVAGCVITDGSTVVVGQTRSAIDPSDVKLYSTPPTKYEQIAFVSSKAAHDFQDEQTLVNAAIEVLKREAAKVGANGIILKNIGDYQIGSSGVVILPNSSTGVVTTSSRSGKQLSGTAIYVNE